MRVKLNQPSVKWLENTTPTSTLPKTLKQNSKKRTAPTRSSPILPPVSVMISSVRLVLGLVRRVGEGMGRGWRLIWVIFLIVSLGGVVEVQEEPAGNGRDSEDRLRGTTSGLTLRFLLVRRCLGGGEG